MTDHKTLERYVLLAGIFATGEDRAQFEELADDIRALLEENKRLEAALIKINEIRNSIVGLQAINWSEHIYPLVAALDEAGCVVGMSYPENRKNFGTMLERTNKAEARIDAALEKIGRRRATVSQETEAVMTVIEKALRGPQPEVKP